MVLIRRFCSNLADTKKPHIAVKLFCEPTGTKLELFNGRFETIKPSERFSTAK